MHPSVEQNQADGFAELPRLVAHLRNWNPWVRRDAERRLTSLNLETALGAKNIGLLLQAWEDRRLRRALTPLLTHLLPLLDAEKARQMEECSLKALRHALVVVSPHREPDFVLAVLQAVGLAGDVEARGAVTLALEKTTFVPVSAGRTHAFRVWPPERRAGWQPPAEERQRLRRIHSAARSCLNRLEREAARRERAARLLRPSHAPEDAEAYLLRPAPSAPDLDPECLLRPGEAQRADDDRPHS